MQKYLESLSPDLRGWLASLPDDESASVELLYALDVATTQPELAKVLDLARHAVAAKEIRGLAWAVLLASCFDHPKAEALVDRLMRHSDIRLRLTALEAVQISESRAALRRAVGCVSDSQLDVAEKAVHILRQAGEARLAPLLTELLDKGDTTSLTDAANALAAIQDDAYLPLLSRCYEKAGLVLRKKLIAALSLMDSQAAAEELQLLSQHDPELSGDLRDARALVVGRLAGDGEEADGSATEGVSANAQPEASPAPPSSIETPPESPAGAIRFLEVSGAEHVVPPELLGTAPPPRPSPILARLSTTELDAARKRVDSLLKKLVGLNGSDLHLKAGLVPHMRHDGRLVPMREEPLDRHELLAGMRAISRAESMEEYLRTGDLDLSYGLTGVARFRLNFMLAGGEPTLVARVIPTEAPSMNSLGLPEIIHELALAPKGLVLVTGPTGSGKSTTLAAMIDMNNSVRKGHIITVEDPIEFIHRDKQCTVTQREVGTDVTTFAEGVRFALRQDPDVLLVGELRDLETVSAALQAAGAGRLVLATLHTNSAAKTIERLLNVFPADEQPQARVSLAMALTGVISQTLGRKKNGGRVAIHEILVATGGVRKAIREKQTQSIYGLMESGSALGMSTLEQGLARLVGQNVMTQEDAMALANEPSLLGML